jgi:hypothetical protein
MNNAVPAVRANKNLTSLWIEVSDRYTVTQANGRSEPSSDVRRRYVATARYAQLAEPVCCSDCSDLKRLRKSKVYRTTQQEGEGLRPRPKRWCRQTANIRRYGRYVDQIRERKSVAMMATIGLKPSTDRFTKTDKPRSL